MAAWRWARGLILDSNILIAILENPDSPEADWVANTAAEGGLRCNPVIRAEIASNFESADDLQQFLDVFALENEPFSLVDSFAAGSAFIEYRRRGGMRPAILPDFLIGAQAAMRGWSLVTRDRKGYASYFPNLTIIDPLEDIE